MKEYLDKIHKYHKNFIEVRVGYSDKKKIEDAALRLLNVKDLNQLRDRYEGALFYKRFLRQLSAEIAVEKLLSYSFINWEKKATVRDHPGIIDNGTVKIGITPHDFGEYPILIDDSLDLPQIFTIAKGKDTVYVCGYADIETLREHNLEFPKKVVSITKKVIFTGVEYLERFESYEELEKLYTR